MKKMYNISSKTHTEISKVTFYRVSYSNLQIHQFTSKHKQSRVNNLYRLIVLMDEKFKRKLRFH